MCDTSAFFIGSGDDKVIITSIDTIIIEGAAIKIANIFGETREVSGSIKKIDLGNNRIEIIAI